MTIDELESLLRDARWFENLARPLLQCQSYRQIPNLRPWANLPTDDPAFEVLADQMAWLPSSRDQEDPFHGKALESRSFQLGKQEEFSRQTLEIYKIAAASLRRFNGHDLLRVGPHDFTEAARGAALFASRRAALEVLLNDCSSWCSILGLYHAGHWPCGILPDRTIVVF